MLEVGECADSGRGELERLGLRRELPQPARELLQSMRIDCRPQELERDMQIRARDPSHAVVRMPQLVDGAGDGIFDRFAHPDCDERAHSLGLARAEVVAQIGWCLTFRPMRHRKLRRTGRSFVQRAADSDCEFVFDQWQAVVAEEHRALDEHRRRAEAAARDQLLDVGAQPGLVLIGRNLGEEFFFVEADLDARFRAARRPG